MTFQRRMCLPFHEFSPDYGDDEMEALAKLGFNQVMLNTDSWPPCAPQLFQMVESEVFPGIGDPEIVKWASWWLPEQVNRARRFGMEPYIHLFEPLIPFDQFSVYAPQSVREEYKPFIEDECLGFLYGSPETDSKISDPNADPATSHIAKWGRPLCISHPKVQKFYRCLVRDLARMLPGLKGLIVVTGDGRMQFCDHNCPRCKSDKPLSPHSYQMKGFVKLLNIMDEGAKEVRDDFEIVLDNGGLLEGTFEVLNGANYSMPVWMKATGVDADMAPTEVAPIYRRLARQLRESKTPFYAVSEFVAAEEYGLIMGYPDPITIIRKVQGTVAENPDGISVNWGIPVQAQTVNDRAFAAVIADPEKDALDILREVTEEVFGKEAAKAWVRVWHCVRSASEVWMMKRGYHHLRQNFYAARFKLFAWPVTFTLTSPEEVPEWNWQWPMCFGREIREANLLMMPELLEHLDCAIEAAEEALRAIPAGTKPLRQVYKPHESWDSRRYGQEAIDAIRCIREIVNSEMNSYLIAQVRDVVEDKRRSKEERRAFALGRLPELFRAEGETIERLLPYLERQLAHVRVPRLPEPPFKMRTAGNTEKLPERYVFIPQLKAKVADVPFAMGRAEKWLERKLGE